MKFIIVFWSLIVFKQVDVMPNKTLYGNIQGDTVEVKATNFELEKKYQIFTSTTDAQAFINAMPVNSKDVAVYTLGNCNEVKNSK